MDINYNVSSWPITLRTMTMVNMTSSVLKAVGLVPRTEMHPVIMEALQRIEKLELPRTVIDEMKSIIHPIMMVMLSWYKDNHDSASIALTPHGTIDLTKSVRAFLNSKHSITSRFKTACIYCHEDDILTLGRDLRQEDKRRLLLSEGGFIKSSIYACVSLPEFWLCAYQGRFDVRISLSDLPDVAWKEGLVLALNSRNSTAVNFFLKKASQKSIREILMNYRFLLAEPDFSFSPDTYSAMFSMLNEHQKPLLKRTFSKKLLLALLEWPYQKLFLKAAKVLAEHLGAEEYFIVARQIVMKPAHGHIDHDYCSLFVSFWQLGARHRNCSFIHSFVCRYMTLHILLLRSHRISRLVFDEVAEEDKNRFLFEFDCNGICYNLVLEKEFRALEHLLRVCLMADKETIRKFQGFFSSCAVHNIPIRIGNADDSYCWTRYEWRARIKRFVQATNKIMDNM